MAQKIINEYKNFLSENKLTVKAAQKKEINQFLDKLIRENRNTEEALISLAKWHKDQGNREVYIYFLQILEREKVKQNLSSHMARILSKKKYDSLFKDLEFPPVGSPPDSVLSYTKELVERLNDYGPLKKTALACNAHGIPAAAFEQEKEFFHKADSLEDYLKGTHERTVENLQKHAESQEVWFEQIITLPVVDLVRSNQEILGGILKDGKIFLTKIPYRPDQWLNETDPEKRRYLACHCPMARESLNNGNETIPPLWCHCSAGFAKQKFMALFDQDLEVEVVESVIAGGNVCRFAITVPNEYLVHYPKP